MGQQILEFCSKCHGYTQQEWQIDHDSSPDEPQFSLLCHRCEGIDMTIKKPMEQTL